jgi:hypothetical protein
VCGAGRILIVESTLALKRLCLQRSFRARQGRSRFLVLAFHRTGDRGEGDSGGFRVAESRVRVLRQQSFGVCG